MSASIRSLNHPTTLNGLSAVDTVAMSVPPCTRSNPVYLTLRQQVTVLQYAVNRATCECVALAPHSSPTPIAYQQHHRNEGNSQDDCR